MNRSLSEIMRRLTAVAPAVALVIVMSSLVAVYAVSMHLTDGRRVALQPTLEQPLPKEPIPVTAVSRTAFFGNIYFSRYINDWSMASPEKFAYPFSRMDEFGRENYDAWISGLECPTVAGFQQTSAQEDATLSFNCNPEYLKEAKKWFTAVSLANNHTDNQGLEGFTETQRHLDANNIQYFGHPDPRELSDACDVVALPARVSMDDGTDREGHLPVAMCGYHGFIRLPPDEAIAKIAEYAPYMPVIAMPHMGKEYVPASDAVKQRLYRAMIDYGADMVIGDHPHWIQEAEVYKGKPIFYSMGNFIFDQQYSAEVTRSAGIGVDFKVNNAQPEQLDAWLKLGSSCASYKDSCLKNAAKIGWKRLPYEYEIHIIGTDNSGKIVKPASEAVRQGIEARLQWSKVRSELAPPYYTR